MGSGWIIWEISWDVLNWHKGHWTLDTTGGVFWFPLQDNIALLHISSFISTFCPLCETELWFCGIEWREGLFWRDVSGWETKFLLQHPFIVSPVLPKADLTGSLSSGMLGEQGPCVGETSVVYTRWMVRPLQSLVGNSETETGAVSATTNLWNGFYQFQLIQTQMNPEQFKVHHPVYKLTWHIKTSPLKLQNYLNKGNGENNTLIESLLWGSQT